MSDEDQAAVPDGTAPGVSEIDTARGALRDLVNQERERHPLVIAFVAPLGTPLDAVEKAFRDALQRFNYDVEHIHLSWLLDDCPYQPWDLPLPSRGDPTYYKARMDAGDQLRNDVGEGSALAALAIGAILQDREGRPANTAYLIRSLKHPDEARILRQVYGDAFSLVAVASTFDERRDNLARDLSHFEHPPASAEMLIARDEADDSRRDFGQRVRDVYQMADFFLATGSGLDVTREVERFTDSIFGGPFITPRMEEEAMRLAYDASLRSAAIGRQVGAALVPRIGTPVVIGTNEVSRPGGGQYWTGDVPDLRDFQTGNDPNPLYTNRVVQELLERLAAQGWLTDAYADLPGHELLSRAAHPDDGGESVLKGARASALIEFTRCMHAEQAAIVNAARAGVSTEGAFLFSTTFPCHECAKMIVGAGIVQVFYIEPYPKSLVSRLYRDVIDTAPPLNNERGLVGGKVPFRAFVGVAPRRYENAFVAADRGTDGLLVDFDRSTACPTTSGWTSGIEEREAIAVKAIFQVLDLLSSTPSSARQLDDRDDRVTAPVPAADPPSTSVASTLPLGPDTVPGPDEASTA